MSTTGGPTDDAEGSDPAHGATSTGGPDRSLAPQPGPAAVVEPAEDTDGAAVEQGQQSQQ